MTLLYVSSQLQSELLCSVAVGHSSVQSAQQSRVRSELQAADRVTTLQTS